MTSTRNNNLLKDAKGQKILTKKKGQTGLKSALIFKEARWIVDHIVERSEEVINTLLENGSGDLDIDSSVLAKDVIYCCMAVTSNNPLFFNPDAQSCLSELKTGICSCLFQRIYDSHPSGSQFEYFAIIFEKEYQQLQDDISRKVVSGLEMESEGHIFSLSKNIMESLVDTASVDRDTKDLILGLVEDLVKVVSLRISKTLLS